METAAAPHASGDSISSAAGEIYEFCAKNIIMAVAAAGDCGAEPDGTQTYLHFGGGLPSSRGAMLGLFCYLSRRCVWPQEHSTYGQHF